jgi:tRNA pseudouridine55 synthase
MPTVAAVQEACTTLEGEIEQVPPQISAIKIAGRPAYKRAARGQPVALEPRPVRVYWLHVHAYTYPEIDFEVCCGRGTYVRSLIRDLGTKLSTGGCLTSLVRGRVGPFEVGDAWTLEALQAVAAPEEYLIDLGRAQQWLDPDSVEIPGRPSRS